MGARFAPCAGEQAGDVVPHELAEVMTATGPFLLALAAEA